jgi:hypothetical protein
MKKYLGGIFYMIIFVTTGAILIYNGQVAAGFLAGVMYQLSLICERLDEIKRKLPTNLSNK